MADPADLRARMVSELGDELGPWRPAFADVPRHAFIPPLVWRQQRGVDGNDMHPLHRDEEPDEWLAAAYANRPVDTQVDDGHAADDGTGTGYNAALLAHRLGPENVVTIEIDPHVADHARAALDATGFGKVTVVTGDGADGYAPTAPYDRVISTAGVTAVPYNWVSQTVPGGRLVLPMTATYQPPGILTLTVHRDGTASGRLGRPASFMALRAQRIPRPRGRPIDTDAGTVSTTDVHPYRVAGDRDAAVAIGMRVSAIHKHYAPETDDAGTQWLLDPDTDSWAAIALTPDPPHEVRQGGPRRLWDEVEAAYRWWLDAGRPDVGAWRYIVTPTGQRVELEPDSRNS